MIPQNTPQDHVFIVSSGCRHEGGQPCSVFWSYREAAAECKELAGRALGELTEVDNKYARWMPKGGQKEPDAWVEEEHGVYLRVVIGSFEYEVTKFEVHNGAIKRTTILDIENKAEE